MPQVIEQRRVSHPYRPTSHPGGLSVMAFWFQGGGTGSPPFSGSFSGPSGSIVLEIVHFGAALRFYCLFGMRSAEGRPRGKTVPWGFTFPLHTFGIAAVQQQPRYPPPRAFSANRGGGSGPLTEAPLTSPAAPPPLIPLHSQVLKSRPPGSAALSHLSPNSAINWASPRPAPSSMWRRTAPTSRGNESHPRRKARWTQAQRLVRFRPLPPLP